MTKRRLFALSALISCIFACACGDLADDDANAVTEDGHGAESPEGNLAAVAPGTGRWRPYGNSNPVTSSTDTWRCGATRNISGETLLAQVCSIRSPDKRKAQVAVIVRNNRSSLSTAEVVVNMNFSNGDSESTPPSGSWKCSASGVAARSWSVCFGPLRTVTTGLASGSAKVNGVSLSPSPWL